MRQVGLSVDTSPHRFCAFCHFAFSCLIFSYKFLEDFRAGQEDLLCFP